MADLTAPTMAIYLATAVPLTIWVGTTLRKHGRIFLVDVFHGNEDVADAVNSLLVVGFMLFNLGYVFLFVKTTKAIGTAGESFTLAATKIGTVSMFLGAFHLVNLIVFTKVRKSAMKVGTTGRPLWPANSPVAYAMAPGMNPGMAPAMNHPGMNPAMNPGAPAGTVPPPASPFRP